MTETFNHKSQSMPTLAELRSALNLITTERSYSRGDSISSISDLRSHLFFIVSGSARVYFINQGKEHTYSFAFENEYVSLSFPLLHQSDYVTTIEFLEPSEVAIVPLEKLKSTLAMNDLATSSIIVERVFAGILKQMSVLEERLIMMQTCSAEERFKWLIERYPKILERVKITQIASFLGVTKETLYRIRSGKY